MQTISSASSCFGDGIPIAFVRIDSTYKIPIDIRIILTIMHPDPGFADEKCVEAGNIQIESGEGLVFGQDGVDRGHGLMAGADNVIDLQLVDRRPAPADDKDSVIAANDDGVGLVIDTLDRQCVANPMRPLVHLNHLVETGARSSRPSTRPDRLSEYPSARPAHYWPELMCRDRNYRRDFFPADERLAKFHHLADGFVAVSAGLDGRSCTSRCDRGR